MKNQLSFVLLFFAAVVCGQNNTISLISGALRADFGPGGALQAPNNGHFLSLLADGQYEPLLFEAGLLIGGLDPSGNLEFHDLRGASNTPGFIGNTDQLVGPWRVTAEEIAAHQADYADNGVIDNPIASIFSWPARGNAFFEEYNGVSIDPSPLSIAYFWDQDFDATYEPNEGDYPMLELRGCIDRERERPITEMIFFPIISTPVGGGEPLQIFLTAFRVGCEETDHAISNAIFLHYKIIRKSSEPLTEARYGFFVDGDIGCPADDYVGTFPNRSAAYFYNADATDDNCIPTQNGFGDNPPAFAIDAFRVGLSWQGEALSVSNTMPVFNAGVGGFPAATIDYATPAEAYNYLQGHWRDGLPLRDEAIGYIGGNPTNYAFAGNPLDGEGWSEIAANNPGGDRKIMLSSESFTHVQNSVNEFVIGFTHSKNPSVSHLEQINELRENVDLIQAAFDNCFAIDETTAQFLGCSPLTALAEITDNTPRLNIYPNPTNGLLQIEADHAGKGMLQVYQSNGQLLLEKEVNNGTHQLDVSSWPKGLYLLQWKSDLGVVTEKVLVQ